MYLPLRPTLRPIVLIAPRHELPFPLDRADAVLYEFSKNGIWRGISSHGLAPGDTVVVPSYICRSALKPLYDFGLELAFFRINERLEPDREDLEAHLKAGAKALLFVHYFGFPQDLHYFATLRERYGVILIEDCAHTLMSRWEDTPLGSVGDISIFCLRKFLPIVDGGAMLLKVPLGDGAAEQTPQTLKAVKGTLDLMVKHFEFLTGTELSRVRELLRMRRRVLNDNQRGDERAQRISGYDRGISAPSRYLLTRLDWDSIFKRRRENYDYLLDRITDMPGLTPVFGALSDGVCPQVLPTLVNDRDDVLASLRSKGILAGCWPVASDAVADTNCMTAEFMNRHMLILPVQQNLRKHHLEWCAEQIRATCRGLIDKKRAIYFSTENSNDCVRGHKKKARCKSFSE